MMLMMMMVVVADADADDNAAGGHDDHDDGPIAINGEPLTLPSFLLLRPALLSWRMALWRSESGLLWREPLLAPPAKN